MRVVMVVIIVVHPAPTTATTPAAGHRHAALFADLRVLCFHAGGDFRPVRDELGTQPHRIGRTSLLNVDRPGALGAGLVKATEKQCADRQRQPVNEKRGPHLSYPGLEKSSRCGPKVADQPSMVQAKNPGYPAAYGGRLSGWPRQNPGLCAGGFRQCPWCSAQYRPRRFPPSRCQRPCAGKISHRAS